MLRGLQEVAKQILAKFGVGVGRYSTVEGLRQYQVDVKSVLRLPEDDLIKLLGLLPKSKSQLGQDLFVLLETGFKRGGYFVEIGATNGVDLSNSHLLEKEFGWDGIVVEPAKCWHAELRANRACHIETDCVWRESGATVQFNEVPGAEFSTISDFSGVDRYKSLRRGGSRYPVRTINLPDLLAKYDAPHRIDYLSVDTEGSEFEILSAFDFSKYDIPVITCEHNYTKKRQKISDLLCPFGYRTKYTGLSKWDDWYVKE